MSKIISDAAIKRRTYWVNEIKNLSGNFSNDYDRLEKELTAELSSAGISALIDHLRLCGNIPESYKHDSSEEKLYSKYTDCLLSLAFNAIGFRSLVMTERGDAADVEVFGNGYDFVADAKAFRLSRTAKNQKDFKIEAMHGWKRGKSNAMVVCPIYQLPNTSSQIYQSATSRDVCVFTYSHLALLLCYSQTAGSQKVQQMIGRIFKVIPALNPSKSATAYWLAVNQTMLNFSTDVANLWSVEKAASIESVAIAKEEDLRFLSDQRALIMSMDHQQALRALIQMSKIDEKISIINGVRDSGIFTIK
ncbi:type II restriction enzyme [Spirosoma lacussanchae]|uniref:HindIII family type II restriction endonuclease n=1 Tax=Spirosoma lacussanchae TaxID=1884249 RepID=UPI001107BD48|nr:HindIII family type II restriction endonuclease [Spirosoma lacussanchae]